MPADKTDDENLYCRSGIWWVRVRIDGKEHRSSLRTRSKATARKKRDALIEKWKGESGPSYKDAYVRFASEFLTASVKPSTAARYRISFVALDRKFRDASLADITNRSIAEFVSERKKQRVTNATIRRDLTALSRLLAHTVQWGMREDNPAKAYDRALLRERREPIQPPTDDEIRQVCAKAPPMVARLLWFLRYTGCRRDEALGLEWPQISLRKKEVTFIRTKTSRPRVIGLTPEAVGTLEGTPRHIESRVVFWHGDGERYALLSSQFARICRRVGVSFRLHDLRHKFAIEWLRAGKDIYDLQHYLGHTSVATTEIYTKWLRREAERKADEPEGTKEGTGTPVLIESETS